MKLFGLRAADGTVLVATTAEEGHYGVLTDLADFWADPAASVAQGVTRRVPAEDVALVPPVLPGARVFCIGVNYYAHAAEGSYRDKELPPHPTLFARWPASLCADGDAAPVPSNEPGLDWEAEVAAFVGRTIVDASADEARSAIFGYAPFNDLTSRTAQKLTSQWILGKNGDNSGPMGALTTADEVPDLREGLTVETLVNGRVMQNGNTRDMIYELGGVLSLISHTITLTAGDVICTGTPEGVGYARTPPIFLTPGDTVEVRIGSLGSVVTPIVGNDARIQATRAGTTP